MERFHLLFPIEGQLPFACVSLHRGKLGLHELNLEILIKIVKFVHRFLILALGNIRPMKFATHWS